VDAAAEERSRESSSSPPGIQHAWHYRPAVSLTRWRGMMVGGGWRLNTAWKGPEAIASDAVTSKTESAAASRPRQSRTPLRNPRDAAASQVLALFAGLPLHA